MPIKPIGPQKAVIPPASILVLKNIKNRESGILTPRVLAYVSPSKRAFNTFLLKVQSEVLQELKVQVH